MRTFLFNLQYFFQKEHMDIKLDHVTQVIGYHPKYLEHFLRTQNFILYADGPLLYDYRNYLAIMVRFDWDCNQNGLIYNKFNYLRPLPATNVHI